MSVVDYVIFIKGVEGSLAVRDKKAVTEGYNL